MKTRVKRIFNYSEESVDAIIIKNSTEPFIDDNFFYATGINQGLFEGNVAVLYPDGNIDLIVSTLEEEIAFKSDADVKVFNNKDEYYNLLDESLKNCSNIGVNYNTTLYKDFYNIREKFSKKNIKDVSAAFTKSRMIKDQIEIKYIKKAAEISDKALEKIPQIIKPEITEYELASEINYIMQKNGADKNAFDTISSFGANTSKPHYTHGKTKLKYGDFIICDIGANYKKYNSDITRTFIYGKPNERQKKMYNTVIAAQKIGLNEIKPGVKANKIHESVEKYIDDSEFKGCFIHSTGHFLGLAVHDLGVGFKKDSNTVLEENMVLTVEPGIYIPGFGGVRIEDDIIVKKEGVEIITKSTRELIEI